MKIKLDGVQETLLIPLLAKAKESKKSDGLLKDRDAEEMMEKIDYDFAKFDKVMSQRGVIARTIILDREIQKYIDTYPDALCISIGCGLDTRYQRLKHRQIKWVNLDFPEVIALRKKLLQQEGKNVQYIDKSALDPQWSTEVPKDRKHVIIILEGILMYFTEEEVIQLFLMLQHTFQKCTVFAEIMHPVMASQSKNHDTVKNTNAVFRWGIKSGKEMENMCRGLTLKREWNLTEEMGKMSMMCRILGSIPFIRNCNEKVVELELRNPS